MDQPTYKRHEDDDWIDEVRITTVPRYKTSGLSGDEWRFSYCVQFFRKGIQLFEQCFGRLEWAIDYLPSLQHDYRDHAIDTKDVDWDRFCANPGCPEDGVVEYELIDEYIPRHGIKEEKRSWRGSVRRRFCEKHATRGDCGFEDADCNYRLISAPPGWKGNADLGTAEAASPSIGPIFINEGALTPEGIKQAMDQVIKERDDDKGTLSN